jgi:hypothetical protein
MIAFDEARFILQAAAAQPSLLSLRWFGTDAVAFSPLIVNDPVALQVAQQVQLSATIFTGEGEETSQQRVDFMSRLFNANKTTPSPYAASLSDCMGMFLNCRRSIMRQENTTGASELSNVFQSLQPTTKRPFFGVSGLLQMDENGDRRQGDWRTSAVANSSFTQSMVGTKQPWAIANTGACVGNLAPDRWGPAYSARGYQYHNFTSDLVQFMISSGCTRITINATNPVSFEPLSVNSAMSDLPPSFLVPANFGMRVALQCRGVPVNIACPPSRYFREQITCVISSGTESTNTSAGQRVARQDSAACNLNIATCIFSFGTTGCVPAALSCSPPSPPRRKVICDELYRQGLMERDIWEADENFGMLIKEHYPHVRSVQHVFAISPSTRY